MNLRDAFTGIYHDRGRLTPQDVIDTARPKDAPLHGRYEWDNGVAGEQYRLIQAARDIRSCRLEFTNPDTPGERKYVRAFSPLRHSGEPEATGYRPTDEVMSDPLAARILLRQCERDIADLRRKYGHLAEFESLLRREINGGAA